LGAAAEALAGDLEQRFSADYQVMGEMSAQAELERLAARQVQALPPA